MGAERWEQRSMPKARCRYKQLETQVQNLVRWKGVVTAIFDPPESESHTDVIDSFLYSK